jgi:hypothetical protein
MSLRSIGAVSLLTVSAMFAAPPAWAQDATVHQVYQAAEAGKLIEAQAMMDKVLRDHPNSGKAHFIEAELLARQGKFTEARAELANAERLAPGLPFAKPAAVEKLKSLVGLAEPAPAAKLKSAPDMVVPAPAAAPAPAASGGMPWGAILGIGALAVLAMAWFRNKAASRGAVQQGYSQTAGPVGTEGMGARYPQYANATTPPYDPAAPGAGLGSRIAGGLATGAALGAGMVAGEALMHHFTDGKRGDNGSNANHLASGNDPLSTPDPLLSPEPPAHYDMGGDDFGVSDPGSWDDGGGGGGGDEWT